MLTIREINSAIMQNNLTIDELNSVIDAVKFARAQLTRRQARVLRTGDTVKFTSNKNGMTYNGTIEKVKLKFALVRTPTARFNVPLSMLEAV